MAGSSSDQDLVKQLERLEQKLDRLESTTGSARRSSLILTIALTAVVLCMLYVGVIKPILDAYKGQEAYKKAITESIKNSVIPEFRAQSAILLEEIKPTMARALSHVQEKKVPEAIKIIEGETTILVNNLKDGLTAEVKDFADDFSKSQYDKLSKQFPEIATSDGATKYSGKVADLVDRVATRMINDMFSVHFGAITELETTFNKFEVPEEVSRLSDPALVEHSKNLIAELLAVKFSAEHELSVGK